MQRRDLLLTATIGFGLGLTQPKEAGARAIDVSFQQMIDSSDLIVVADVIEVFKDNGVEIARAVPKRTYKGEAPKVLYFLAEGTWTCDQSNAVKGETAIFHLQKAKSQSIMFNFRKDQVKEVASKPLYLQTWDGRGRMPIESVRGVIKVTMDHYGATDLPKSIVPEWEGPAGNLHKRVPFDLIERLLKQEITRQALETPKRS